MAVTNWRLEHFKDLQATGTPDNIIKEFSKPQIVTSVGDGRDSFQFDVKTSSDVLRDIEINDKVLIKREVNGTQFGSDTVVMNGAINKDPRKLQTSRQFESIKGNNYSKTVMDAITFVDARKKPLDEAFKEALNYIKNYSSDFAVEWASTNPSSKTNGDPFPEVGEKWYDEPMRKLLQEFSKDSRTEDGDYYWYINTDNELVWKPETDTVKDTIQSGFPYKTIELGRDTENIVNFVKVKGGTLPTSNAIEAQYIDFGSAGKHGLRFKAIEGNEKYVDDLHNDTMNAIGANENDIRPSEVSGFSYPMSASTADWNTDNPDDDENNGSDISGDEEYFLRLKAGVKQRLKDDGKDFVDNEKNGYYTLELEVHPKDNIFQLGELFLNQLSGFPGDKYRVKEIQYTDTMDVISLREDEPSI